MPRPLVRLGALAATGLLLAAAACGSSDAHSADGRVAVVASFYPLAWAAEQVGGDLVSVTNLTAAGQEPHDLELTAKARQSLETADVVLVMGRGFQPSVESAVDDRDSGLVEILDVLPLDEAPTDADDEALDPHVWLDPVLMIDVVEAVAEALTEADSAHADTFADNAATVRADLETLDDDYSAGLASCDRTLLVTSHDAFGYLADRYGLEQASIAGLSPDEEPSPARLAELTDLVKEDGVTTIYTEELVSPAVAKSLASEAGLKTAVLNPLEGLTQEQLDDGVDYVSAMRENLTKLQSGLGCSN